MPKYTGHEFLDVLSKTEYNYKVFYNDNYEVEWVFIHSSKMFNSYLLKKLPKSLNICAEGEREYIETFVGCPADIKEIDKLLSGDNVQIMFMQEYLKHPYLVNMEINLEHETMYFRQLQHLSVEHMSIEMYEYLFNE